MTVYIVLGVLYESLIHPLTILSTLPSAGVGALLALIATLAPTSLNVVSLIGIILLIGIVKKNAIMMIDFAIAGGAQRRLEAPNNAIFQACVLRFRPIMMTTMAALLGGLPLALGRGEECGDAASARYGDRRRIAVQPGADVVHDPGGLSVSRSNASALGAHARPRPPRRGADV